MKYMIMKTFLITQIVLQVFRLVLACATGDTWHMLDITTIGVMSWVVLIWVRICERR